MAAKLLNIEIGDRLVKVCLAVRRGKAFQITNSFMFPTPDQTVTDGQVVDPETLAGVLREQLAINGAGGVRNVTFTLTTTKVASRVVMLPPVKDKQLKAVVETNAADYFPVDMTGYQVSFNLLERVNEPAPGCRVLVMAAPKSMMIGYVRLAKAAGLTLDAIDYTGNSQYQVLRTIPTEKPVMYVDVNVGSTTVSFMHNGVLLMQRIFNFGGDDLVSAAQRAANRPEFTYLDALNSCADTAWLNQTLSTADQADCLNRLVAGIARSADFFKSRRASVEVAQVVLMGTCCRVAGLRELVEQSLDIDTVLLTQVKGVRFVANSAESISTYISCVGSLIAPLSFLPEELRRKHSKRERQSDPDSLVFGAVVCIACVCLAVGMSAFSIGRYLMAANRQKTLQARADELAYVQQTYDTYISYEAMTQNLALVNANGENVNANLTALFDELEKKMPSSILLLSATCDADGVTMYVTVPGMEEAAVVLSQLRGFESFDVLTVSTITETADDTGYTTATFTVSCAYPEAEADTAETPAETAETEADAADAE